MRIAAAREGLMPSIRTKMPAQVQTQPPCQLRILRLVRGTVEFKRRPRPLLKADRAGAELVRIPTFGLRAGGQVPDKVTRRRFEERIRFDRFL